MKKGNLNWRIVKGQILKGTTEQGQCWKGEKLNTTQFGKSDSENVQV